MTSAEAELLSFVVASRQMRSQLLWNPACFYFLSICLSCFLKKQELLTFSHLL